ncbi:DsbA family oxidoreductase [Pectinatus haikarae]|uniref:DsbA family dithiol-disulfide isomerase n=1 Tax=Pectinatus haikarae TaxID=349096 RepID=A0ABT9Y7B7_9FIRM|nr:DsbA family protein [Pectinatus haikarae]MDQ0203112.1 putative DsbA family dithiol-disulfide isomerase [Pectinatus haikarae]
MSDIYEIKGREDAGKLEVFFDYACPYCYRGHKNLMELMKKYPKLDIIWRPCEAHPRPEEHGVHSDLAICGMYFVLAHAGDLMKYHKLAFEATFEHHKDISDIAVLSDIAEQCSVDKKEFTEALTQGLYQDLVTQGNIYAWSEKEFDAVPSYARGMAKIGSGNGVMVTIEELEKFIQD